MQTHAVMRRFKAQICNKPQIQAATVPDWWALGLRGLWRGVRVEVVMAALLAAKLTR